MIQFTAHSQGRGSFEDNLLPSLVYICPIVLDHEGQAMHAHAGHAELLLVREGIGVVRIEGRQEDLFPGDFVLCGAGEPHSFRAKGERPAAVVSCGFSNLTCRGLKENCFVGSNDRCIVHAGEGSRPLDEILYVLESVVDNPQTNQEELCSYLSASAVTVALKIHRAAAKQAEQTHYQLGIRTQMYLDRHYLENLTLDSIAQAMEVSKYHLDRVFLATTGCTPVQYITRRRLAHAQTLLASTQQTVQHIAEQCGYTNYNYFTSLFRRNVGITPREYRKIAQGNMPRRNN